MNFEDYKIYVNLAGREEQRVKCPECTPWRKKKNIKDLAVNIIKGTWVCHHCGWKGSLNADRRINSVRIPKKIYKRPGPIKSFHIPDNILDYWNERKISTDTLIRCGVNYEISYMTQTEKKEECTVFNYYINGELINRKYRPIEKIHKMEKDARLVLYAPLSKEKFDYNSDIYITEGEPDCLTMIELGFFNSLSVPNGAPPENVDIENVDFSYLDSLEEIAPKYNRVFLVMDNDPVGSRLRDEIARRIGVERCFKAEYPEGCKDINDVLVKHGKDKAIECVKECKQYPVAGKYDVCDLYEDVYKLWINGFDQGMSTGWQILDKLYTVRQKEFTIVTGIPSHGKSSWIDHLLVNLARSKNWGFGIFSPENFPFQRHIAKFCEIYTGKPFDRNYRGAMSEEELADAVQWCNNHFHFIMPEDEDNQTLENILRLAKASIFKDGIQGIVIDPWNEIEHEIGKDSETIYISKALTKIRRFCRVNNIHAWIIAHPTKLQKKKNGDYPIPTPYDIAGSAHFRNKADNCICVNRDFNTDETEIIIQKIRFKEIGRVGKRKFRFNLANGRYTEVAL